MNNITELPNKILVKIMRDKSGVFVAELPEYDLHTEADTIWDLISNINDIIKLYFDIPKDKLSGIVFIPSIAKKEPELTQPRLMDFMKYHSSSAGVCFH